MSNEGTLFGQFLILLTTLAGFVFTWFLTARRRKWDLEDVDRKARALEVKVQETAAEVKRETQTAADVLAQTVVETADDVKKETHTIADALAQTVIETAADVKQDALAAYDVANRVNAKILAMNINFDKLLQEAIEERKLEAVRVIDEVTRSAVLDTHEKVEDIHERVVPDDNRQ